MSVSGDDHEEFLAAVAAHHVGLAGRLVQEPGDLLQGLVPAEVALLVVDVLEVIDVEQGHEKPTLVAAHQGQLAGRALRPARGGWRFPSGHRSGPR